MTLRLDTLPAALLGFAAYLTAGAILVAGVTGALDRKPDFPPGFTVGEQIDYNECSIGLVEVTALTKPDRHRACILYAQTERMKKEVGR